MRAVNCTVRSDCFREKAIAVYKENVRIAAVSGVQKGLHDDRPALLSLLRIYGIWLCNKQHGKQGMSFADHFKERLMRFLEVCGVRSIIIVIHYKGRHVQTGDIFGKRRFSQGAAGKAEIDIVDIQPAGDHILIRIAWPRSRYPLRNGGTVEHNRLLDGLGTAVGNPVSFFQADPQAANLFAIGEAEQELFISTSSYITDTFIAGFRI